VRKTLITGKTLIQVIIEKTFSPHFYQSKFYMKTDKGLRDKSKVKDRLR
jgi:hypothetical protein